MRFFLLLLSGIAILGGLVVAANVVGTLTSVATAPGRVISKTLETDNIIASYEWFLDANGQIQARIAQVKGHKAILSDTTDASEKSRLRIELAAIQQSCRDLSNRYNANASKINKAIFRADAPESVDARLCE